MSTGWAPNAPLHCGRKRYRDQECACGKNCRFRHSKDEQDQNQDQHQQEFIPPVERGAADSNVGQEEPARGNDGEKRSRNNWVHVFIHSPDGYHIIRQHLDGIHNATEGLVKLHIQGRGLLEGDGRKEAHMPPILKIFSPQDNLQEMSRAVNMVHALLDHIDTAYQQHLEDQGLPHDSKALFSFAEVGLGFHDNPSVVALMQRFPWQMPRQKWQQRLQQSAQTSPGSMPGSSSDPASHSEQQDQEQK